MEEEELSFFFPVSVLFFFSHSIQQRFEDGRIKKEVIILSAVCYIDSLSQQQFMTHPYMIEMEGK